MRTGTSRYNRLAPKIEPSTAPIDNRSISELLSCAKEVAGLLNYFDENGEIKGSWSPFFEKNKTYFFTEILNVNLEVDYKEGNRLLMRFHLTEEDDSAKKADYLVDLINVIWRFYKVINYWEERVHQVRYQALNFDMEAKLLAVNKDFFQPERGFLRVMQTFLIEQYQLEEKKASYPIIIPEAHKTKLSDLAKLPRLNIRLKDIFQKLYQQLYLLQQSAEKELNVGLTQQQNHEPLMGLMIAFLKLFQLQQDHLNQFTKKHLDYYYHQVLRSKHQKNTSDHAYVAFQLAKDVPPYLLQKGTKLLASVDKNGLESVYETISDLWVSDTKIKTLQSLYISRNQDINFDSSYNLVSNIFYAPFANSKDGLGHEFDETQKTWPLVGEDQTVLSRRQRNMIPGSVGVAVAAPILYLEDGDRTINLTLKVQSDSMLDLQVLLKDIADNENKTVADVYSNLFKGAVDIFVSSKKGWIRVDDFRSKPPTELSNLLSFEIVLDKNMPPLVPIDPKVKTQRYSDEWPVIKILLKSGTSIYAYSFFHTLALEEILIKVSVNDLRNLVVKNLAGEYDNSTPFPLFGAIPNKDSEFYIGNRELFLKTIGDLSIDIEWNNLPDVPGGFDTLYKNYQEGAVNYKIENSSFKVQLSALSHAKYFPKAEKDQQILPLFEVEENILKPKTTLENIEVKKLHLIPHLEPPLSLEPLNNDTKLGYLRLALTEPKHAFGHAIYPRILSEVVTHNAFAKANKAWWRWKKEKIKPLPKEPYNPIIKRISLNYKAQSTIDFTGQGGHDTVDELASSVYHISPFGYKAIFEKGITKSQKLLQSFGSDGYLMIGLEDLKPGLPLSLMFELSITGKKSLDAPVDIRWFYLADNEFTQFRKEEFLYDTTFGLTTSGIVNLKIPEAINKENTILPPNAYWLLIAARGEVEHVLGRAVNVTPHAVETSWVNNGDENHYATPASLPKIKDLLVKEAPITSVTQIGGFFGGHPKESERYLWERISERLRHKGRAINLWDFERLTLQKFPEVRQVKCLVAEEKDTWLEVGETLVVAVSEQISSGNLRSNIGYQTLRSIQQYLKSVCSPHVDLKVINPSYEWLKLSASIILKPAYRNEHGKYLQQLYQDIESFICPWLNQGDIKIGGGFKKKDLLNYLRSRFYIDYMTQFSVVHVFEKEKPTTEETPKLAHTEYEFDLEDTANPKSKQDEIRAYAPWGILVPADLHLITIINEPKFIKAEQASIAQMVLETDFVIVEEEEEEKNMKVSNKKKEMFTIMNLD